MAEKGKSRNAGAKSKLEKSRTPVRATPRQSKKPSPKTPGRTPTQHTASSDEELLPKEPLDVGPILDDLLDRVLTEYALAVAARQRVPFTVSRARDAILFVAEWRFLMRDDGDPDPGGDPNPERDGVWSEDEEPQTYLWDSWTPGVVPIVDASLPSEEVPSEGAPATAEAGRSGEVPGAVPVPDVPLSPGKVPSDELPATAEAGGPGRVPDAVPVLAVAPSPDQPPCQARSAAAAAPPAQVLGAVPMPGPPLPELPIAPRRPMRGRRPSRHPQPRAALLDASRPPAPLPAAPSEPPARAPQESREATAKVGDQVPAPPSSSCPSLASIQPRRPSRGTGVPRLGARRAALRWVLPDVRVVDVTAEPERARQGTSRSRLARPGSPPVLPAVGRAPKAEMQLCDPWLASARLAPGVTVRWGSSVRRGPAPAGHGEGEQEEAAMRAQKDLKPILAYPECRISEYTE